MSYRIVAAKPKGATNHCNSSFKTYELQPDGRWRLAGWKSFAEIAALLAAKNEVLTGQVVNGEMQTGAAVEAELRIAENGARFKLSDMPDE